MQNKNFHPRIRLSVYLVFLCIFSAFFIILILINNQSSIVLNTAYLIYNITGHKFMMQNYYDSQFPIEPGLPQNAYLHNISLYTQFEFNPHLCLSHNSIPFSITIIPYIVETLSFLYKKKRKSTDNDYVKCQKLVETLTHFFTFSIHSAHLISRNIDVNNSDSFAYKWFGGIKNKSAYLIYKHSLYNQEIVHVNNKVTNELTIFNLLRGQRRKSKIMINYSSLMYIKNKINSDRENCDFCLYKYNTVLDEMNISLSNGYAHSFSNAFKLDRWHSIIATKLHDPSTLELNDIVGMLDLSLKWFQNAIKLHFKSKLSKENSLAQLLFPMISWDNLPQGGASQFHPHLQCFLSEGKYYGKIHNFIVNVIRDTYPYHIYDNLTYQQAHIAITNYMKKFIDIHYFLNLTTPCPDNLGQVANNKDNCVIIAPIAPIKDNELYVIYQPGPDFFKLISNDGSSYNSLFGDSVDSTFGRFCKAIYNIIDYYRNSPEANFAFSGSIIYPPTGNNLKELYPFPVIAKFISRNLPNDEVSDISSLELYMMNNVVHDPYQLITSLKNYLKSSN